MGDRLGTAVVVGFLFFSSFLQPPNYIVLPNCNVALIPFCFVNPNGNIYNRCYTIAIVRLVILYTIIIMHVIIDNEAEVAYVSESTVQ